MKYIRPKTELRLTKEEKVALMRDYVEYYKRQYAVNPTLLNPKLSREAFSALTDRIGGILIRHSESLGNSDAVIKFLQANPLPRNLHAFLPKKIQTFCLALNALKQWVSAEQQAMDKLILGGTARETCRTAANICIVTGKRLNLKTLKLHHPVRDGRPPLPLSKAGHDKIEGQSARTESNPALQKLLDLKRSSRHSWVHLRRGCLELLNREVKHSTPNVGATSRAFARKAKLITGLDYKQILHWLDANDYGLTS